MKVKEHDKDYMAVVMTNCICMIFAKDDKEALKLREEHEKSCRACQILMEHVHADKKKKGKHGKYNVYTHEGKAYTTIQKVGRALKQDT